MRDYELTPGVAHVYNEGVVHSPRRDGDTKLIRIEGRDLTKISRDKFEVLPSVLRPSGRAVGDWAQILTACDFLGRKKIQLTWGPGRHGPGHNIYTYHRNPDDQIIELFTELDKMLDEDYSDPRPWHRDRPQKPKVWSGPSDVWGPPPTPEHNPAKELVRERGAKHCFRSHVGFLEKSGLHLLASRSRPISRWGDRSHSFLLTDRLEKYERLPQ